MSSIEHGSKPGARRFAALVGKLRRWVRARIEHHRQQAANRRKFRQFLQLDDRLLKDIGLTRGDLIGVQLGVITLQELDAARESRRRNRSHQPVSSLTADQPGDWSEAPGEAIAAAAKCA